MSTLAGSWVPRHRLSVADYCRMADVGLLAPDARVELIDGEIVDMPPFGSAHAGTVEQVCAAIALALGRQAIVGVQRPVRLDERTEPQPDLVLLHPRADFHRGGHPTAADVLLIAEVADATLRCDRDVRIPLYARHAIPEAWLVDLVGRALHVFRMRAAGAYADSALIRSPGLRELAAFPGSRVDLSGLFDR